MQLIERDRELATLRALFAGSLDGRGAVVLLSGAVATGKTALMRAFATGASAAGARFLQVTAAPGDAGNRLGVVRGLLRSLAAADGNPDPAGTGPRAGARAGAETTADALRGFCDTLLTRSARTPLIVGVDDAHHADPASLRCLLALAHRLPSARILLILTERPGGWPDHPLLHAELRGRPHCARLTLRLLSPAGQARLLADRLGTATAIRLSAVSHPLTGGNPLLVRALLTDHPVLGPGKVETVVGPAFTQAWTGCLHRGEPGLHEVAQALAVLREPAPPGVLGRLLGMDTEYVTHLLSSMNAAGLLDGGRFRHPALRTALLDAMGPRRRAALHTHAAGLLHDQGHTAPAVAGHLLAAFDAAPAGERPAALREPWAATVLHEAASRAGADGERRFALDCYRRAYEICPDGPRRTLAASALAEAQWRTEPAAVLPLLPALSDAALDGTLDERSTRSLLARLLWFGRTGEAAELLRTGGATAGPAAAAEWEAMGLLMACACPGLLEAVPRSRPEAVPGTAAPPGPAGGGAHPPSAGPRLRAADALSAALTGAPGPTAREGAEHVLRETRLGEASAGHVLAALAALIYDDRPAEAARWCDPLLKEAATRGDAVGHALLESARAVISLRQGELAAAEARAGDALARISPASWGVAVAVPISVAVLAATATGRHEEAAAHLARPVPDALFETPCGPHYLQARGRHRLATGRPREALRDFTDCGEAMESWGFTAPALVPWRGEAAQALLELGETARAAQLIGEQLALLRPGPSRTRGISLRVQALTAPLTERLNPLRESAALLERCGDRYELMLALTDLSHTQHALGAHDEAFVSARGAHRLARRYGLAGPGPAPGGEPENRPPAPGAPGTAPERPPAAARGELTEAERKVAALAAHGHTNRQIAETLLVTVGTVEQHLTRVYRKLQVNRRTELRPRLRISPV
ncbi:LuxR family transcriptional regulator [Streptomyces amakusaensis]|uniref:AAA family ATPase n=1 Tax=Streptomyces amakusaensis TaxID=67271 RepID=A0ABW0AFW6_9ACTN